MFERLLRTACFAAIAGLLALRGAVGQTVAEYRHELDSLGREWHAAITVKRASDSMQVRSLPPDTVRVGPLIALTDAKHIALVRSTLARLAPAVDTLYGAAERRLTEHPFVLRASPTDSMAIVSGVTDSAGIVYLMSSDFSEVNPLASSWQVKIDQVMTQAAGPEFQKWLRGPIPSEPPTAETWTNARINLVLADSRVSQDCVRGDLHRCMQAFGLVPVTNPAFELYDEAQQRGILDHYGYNLRQRDPATYDRCMTERRRDACTTLLSSIPSDAIPLPLPTTVRQSLVRYALMIGGGGAFDRLVNTTGSPREQLEAAARMPVDSLLGRWRATVMRTERGSNAIDLGTAIASIAWAGLFAGLSLRSSRWR